MCPYSHPNQERVVARSDPPEEANLGPPRRFSSPGSCLLQGEVLLRVAFNCFGLKMPSFETPVPAAMDVTLHTTFSFQLLVLQGLGGARQERRQLKHKGVLQHFYAAFLLRGAADRDGDFHS